MLICETVHPDRVDVAVSRCGRRGEISGPDGIRIRLTGQLVRSALRHLRQRWDRIGVTRGNDLAASPGFSMLPDVRRPSDGPGVDLARRSLARCELGGDLLAVRVLPASPRGGAQGMRSSLAPRPSGWRPSRRAVRRSPPPLPHLRSGVGSGQSPRFVR
jgi:hypothetical protein